LCVDAAGGGEAEYQEKSLPAGLPAGFEIKALICKAPLYRARFYVTK
jgi:hypothetical protein